MRRMEFFCFACQLPAGCSAVMIVVPLLLISAPAFPSQRITVPSNEVNASFPNDFVSGAFACIYTTFLSYHLI